MRLQNCSFELNNQLSDLKALNQHLIDFGRDIGLPELSISEINVCLDELFTNIVLYGFKDDRKHQIKVALEVVDQTLIAIMEDDGVAFNPLKKKAKLPADVDSAQIGGLGIHITKELVDDIRYERKRGINRVTIKKRIQSDGDASS